MHNCIPYYIRTFHRISLRRLLRLGSHPPRTQQQQQEQQHGGGKAMEEAAAAADTQPGLPHLSLPGACLLDRPFSACSLCCSCFCSLQISLKQVEDRNRVEPRKWTNVSHSHDSSYIYMESCNDAASRARTAVATATWPI